MAIIFSGMTITGGISFSSGSSGNVITDPYFSSVSLLLNADGMNGQNNNVFPTNQLRVPTIVRIGNTTQGSVSPFSPAGWSGYFNLAANRISIAANTALAFGTGDFTAEVYINALAASSGTGLTGGVLFGDLLWSLGYQGGWYLSITSSGAVEFVRSGTVSSWDSIISTAGVISLNTWYHIAVVRTSGTTVIYLNGTSLLTFANAQNYTTGRTFYINAEVADSTFYGTFNGYLSNLRLVKGTAVYSGNFTPPSAPLTAIAGTSLLLFQTNTFKDNSTNNFTLTVTGSPSIQPVSPIPATTTYDAALHGGSAYFDGTGDYLTVPYHIGYDFSAASSSFTIELWARFTSIGRNTGIIGMRTSATAAGWGLYISTANQVILYSINHGAITFAGFALAANSWYHIALVRTPTAYTVYVNGVQYGAALASSIGLQNTSQALGIGIVASDGEYPLLGYLSSLRITNGSALYTTTFTPSTSPLVGDASTSLMVPFTNAAIVDAAGKNDIETVGTASLTATSKFGSKAIAFNGSTDYLTVNNLSTEFNFGSGNFTIELWFNSTSTNAYAGLLSRTYQAPGGFTFFLNGATANGAPQIWWYENGGQFIVSSIAGLNNGQWHHIAWVRNGNVHTMYVDGVAAGTATVTTAYGSTTNPIIIGADLSTAGRYLTGSFDDVRITKGIARYTANFTPPTAALPTNIGTDSLFTYVSLLLNGEGGLNNAVNATNNTFATDGTAQLIYLNRIGNTTQGSVSPFTFSEVTYDPATHGGSAYFDGTGDYLTVPYHSDYDFSAASSSFTIEIWAKFSTVGRSNGIIAQRTASAGAGWALYVGTTNQIYFYSINHGGTLIFYGPNIVANTWYHIALVRTPTAYIVYVNGVQYGADLTSSVGLQNTSQALGIGTVSSDGEAPMIGYLSSLRITKGVALYTSAFTPSTVPLVSGVDTTLLAQFTTVGIYDSSRKSDIETVGDAKLSTAIKKYGTASMVFDGSGDYLAIPDSTAFAFGSQAFTVELWVYRTGSIASAGLISTRKTAIYSPFEIYIAVNGQATWLISNANSTAWSTAAGTNAIITLNTWHHVAIVGNGTTLTFYLNGVATATTAQPAWTNITSPIYIGTGGDAAFAGYIDDVRITKGTARYTATFTPPDAALPAVAAPTVPVVPSVVPEVAVTDSYFSSVALLLNADGANNQNNNVFVDSSSNNLAITRYGTTAQGSVSSYSASGWSMYFPSSMSYVTITNPTTCSPGTADFTIEAWVNPEAIRGAAILNGQNITSHIILIYGPTSLQISINSTLIFTTTGGTLTSTSLLSVRTWAHIAITRQGNIFSMYINGLKQSTTFTSSASINCVGSDLLIGNTNSYAFGNTGYAPYSQFNGNISDFRMTLNESLYNSTFVPPVTQLTQTANTVLLMFQNSYRKDNIITSNTTSIVGSPELQATSPFTVTYDPVLHGGSAYMNGSTDYLAITQDIILNSSNFTMEGWFYMTTAKSNGALFSVGTYSTGIMLSYSSLYSAGTIGNVNGLLPLNVWFHAAVVRNGSLLTLYVNGISVYTVAVSGSITPSGGVYIGTSALAVATDSFPGYISDFRVVTGTAVYTTNFTLPTTSLTAITGTSLFLKGTAASITDTSRKNDIETFGNAKLSTTIKKYGTASMAFDGSSVVRTSTSGVLSSITASSFTIECWVYFNNFNNRYQTIVTDYQSTGTGITLGTYNNQLAVSYTGDGVDTYGTSALAANTWYHVALSGVAGSIKLFLNGVIEGSTYAGSILPSSTLPLSIGGYVSSSVVTTGINGYIDDLRITPKVIRYTANFTPPTGPLTA